MKIGVTKKIQYNFIAVFFSIYLSLVSFLTVGSVSADPRAQVTSSRYGSQTDVGGTNIETRLFNEGYKANITTIDGKKALRASQVKYPGSSTWSRDIDYALQGYSYVVDDMSLFRDNIQLFLDRVGNNDSDYGVVPEVVHGPGGGWLAQYANNCSPADPSKNRVCGTDYDNREAWDSMPNIISAVYFYTAKTGDTSLYTQNQEAINRVADWMLNLSDRRNGRVDKNIFPYGYYDSTEDGTRHTYALAKIYKAYTYLGILSDNSKWDTYADNLKDQFRDEYWPDGQDYPLAWKRDGKPDVNTLETFGVFEGYTSNELDDSLFLNANKDETIDVMNGYLEQMIIKKNGTEVPLRLALTEGYDLWAEVGRKTSDANVRDNEPWMSDVAAPWIVGIAAPAFAHNGHTNAAKRVVDAYENLAQSLAGSGRIPVLEFAGPNNDSRDGGRVWDNAGWFIAVYRGHYGLIMHPDKLIVKPAPFKTIENDIVENFSFHGKTVTLELDKGNQTYTIESDGSLPVELKPMSGGGKISVNGSELVSSYDATIHVGETYVVSTDRRSSPASDDDGGTDADSDEDQDTDDSGDTSDDSDQESDEGSESEQDDSDDSDSDSDSSTDRGRNDSEQCPASVREASGDERRRKEVFFCAAYQSYHKAEFEEFGCPCDTGG